MFSANSRLGPEIEVLYTSEAVAVFGGEVARQFLTSSFEYVENIEPKINYKVAFSDLTRYDC